MVEALMGLMVTALLFMSIGTLLVSRTVASRHMAYLIGTRIDLIQACRLIERDMRKATDSGAFKVNVVAVPDEKGRRDRVLLAFADETGRDITVEYRLEAGRSGGTLVRTANEPGKAVAATGETVIEGVGTFEVTLLSDGKAVASAAGLPLAIRVRIGVRAPESYKGGDIFHEEVLGI